MRDHKKPGCNQPSIVKGLFTLMILSGCAHEPTPPPVDVVGTIAAQLASVMLTQTVAAYSPTPPPSTETLIPTETPVPEPTKDPNNRIIEVINQAPCYFGPGVSYQLESYISATKKVELLGIGSVPGWFVIMNPYFHQACWIAETDVSIPSFMDISLLPVISP